MSDAFDEQDEAEALDGDRFDPSAYPPDEPLGLPELEGRDVPVVGDYAPDSVAERDARTEPDFDEAAGLRAPEEPVELIEPDDPFGPDLTSELTADLAEDDGQFDGPYLSEAEDATTPTGSLAAEEAAIHVENESDLGL